MEAPDNLAAYSLEELCQIAENLGFLLGHAPAESIHLRFQEMEMIIDLPYARSLLAGMIGSYLAGKGGALPCFVEKPDPES